MMEVLHARCAGLDVHKDVVMACVRVAEEGKVSREVKSFGTTTSGLLEMSEWLVEVRCTHVVMEATGVYWKPVWHVLEGSFELMLANAQHVRNVPGRKSDVNDATWLADLLAHGLIRGSFVPPAPVQEMRDLTRTRKQLVREVAQHTQRIQKTLEDANVKLSSVISSLLGVTGRAIVNALVAGESDPRVLAALAQTRIHATQEELVEALRGKVTQHHRFMIKLHLEQIDSLQKAVRELEARMGEALAPFREQVTRLTTIPGISDIAAQVIASEVGLDMSRFPTAGHLISWAGLCPRLDESAGKRRSTRVRKGAPWLKTTLVTAAWAAARKKDGYLRAQFLRLKTRRGAKKAIIAVAASMLTAVYHMLTNQTDYADLGIHHFDRRDKVKVAKRLIKRLQDLGMTVEVKPLAA
jgi:transposase